MRTHLDQRTGSRTSEQVFGSADRPLGRGLEDISHLFLSHRRDDAATIEGPSGMLERPERERDELESDSRARTVLLRTGAPVSRDTLAAILRELDAALEEGLRVLDTALPCQPCGEIDLLAVDRTNQLTIIDFETAPSDALLVRGIGHFHWIVDNLPLVQRMYAERGINFSVQPRLFLLAPNFSPLLRSVARQIARPRINWVRYRVLEVSGGQGVFFEPGVGE